MSTSSGPFPSPLNLIIVDRMRLFLAWFPLIQAYKYSQGDADSVCSFQNAEATSPQISPGESASNRLISTLGSNALASYFNANDTSLSDSEVRSYWVDIWPSWMFLVLLTVGVALWSGYCFCVCCKCCYCCLSPATTQLTPIRKRIPLGLSILTAVLSLGLVPVQVYFAT